MTSIWKLVKSASSPAPWIGTAGAEGGYIGSVGYKFKRGEGATAREEAQRTRQAVFEALDAALRGEIAERGPRGGVRWKARYFVRRVGWHVLDHVWEIEDRVM